MLRRGGYGWVGGWVPVSPGLSSWLWKAVRLLYKYATGRWYLGMLVSSLCHLLALIESKVDRHKHESFLLLTRFLLNLLIIHVHLDTLQHHQKHSLADMII